MGNRVNGNVLVAIVVHTYWNSVGMAVVMRVAGTQSVLAGYTRARIFVMSRSTDGSSLQLRRGIGLLEQVGTRGGDLRGVQGRLCASFRF
jgi:hypothetical protein